MDTEFWAGIIVGLLAVFLILGIVRFLKKTLHMHVSLGGEERKK